MYCTVHSYIYSCVRLTTLSTLNKTKEIYIQSQFYFKPYLCYSYSYSSRNLYKVTVTVQETILNLNICLTLAAASPDEHGWPASSNRAVRKSSNALCRASMALLAHRSEHWLNLGFFFLLISPSA